MCMCICILIGLGAALYIASLGLVMDQPVDTKKPLPPSGVEAKRIQRAAVWCDGLAKLMGVVALLLILCCLCCKDVSFAGKSSSRSDYD